MFNNKIDKFEQYDNKISALSQEELELTKRLADVKKEKETLQLERRDFGIKCYLDKEKRREILEQARKLGYSPDKLNELEPYIENWNQDVIDNDKLDSFRIIDKFIINNQEPYNENILYKISQFFGRITAPATTGPASGPLPTSSIPQI